MRPSDIAVLCRKRSQFVPLRRALEARGIPCEVVGLGGLLSVPEVQDVVATLRVLHDASSSDALARLLTGPRWRIGPRDLVALGRRARDLAQGADEAEDSGRPRGPRWPRRGTRPTPAAAARATPAAPRRPAGRGGDRPDHRGQRGVAGRGARRPRRPGGVLADRLRAAVRPWPRRPGGCASRSPGRWPTSSPRSSARSAWTSRSPPGLAATWPPPGPTWTRSPTSPPRSRATSQSRRSARSSPSCRPPSRRSSAWRPAGSASRTRSSC